MPIHNCVYCHEDLGDDKEMKTYKSSDGTVNICVWDFHNMACLISYITELAEESLDANKS
jgi:hypothetical protein